VTNLENNRTIKVVVNDRGPFHHKGMRIIDLSKKAASALGMLRKGVARVNVEYDFDETKELLAHLPNKQKKQATLAYDSVLTYKFALRSVSSAGKSS
jgi:rare lipoprotein A